jgi:lipopolysaccharide export system permease protein
VHFPEYLNTRTPEHLNTQGVDVKILTRYLLREMIVPFLIGQAAIVMMLTGSVLYNNANLFLQYQIPVSYVIRLALYFIPFLIHMTMPVAMAVAASLAVSRLSRDSEITVMRASGVSLVRIFMPIFVTGLIVSIADFYFGEFVIPPTILRYQTVIGELPSKIRQLTPPAGTYIVASDQSYVIGVRSMIPRPGYIEMHGVSLIAGFKLFDSTMPFVASSDTGRYQNGEWIMDDAMVYFYDLNDPQKWQRQQIHKLTHFIPVDPQAFQTGFNLQMPMGQLASSADRTFTKLGEELKEERVRKRVDPQLLLDYHFKLSVPFSCLVMALCCPPIALRFGRGGGFMGTLLSICLVFVYWNTLLLSRILGTPGPSSPPVLPAEVAAWSQNVIFALLGLFVLRKSE